MLTKTKAQFFPFLFLWILVGVMGRIIVHPANITPLTSMSLLAGCLLTRRQSLLVIFATMLFSDIIIGLLFHYPFFGSWTFFTYTGFAVVTFSGSRLSLDTKIIKAIWMVLFAASFYWLWTNFGVWLLSGIYPRTFSGLWACYIAALPFLRHALLGSIVWFVVLFCCLRKLRINNVYKLLFQ